MAVAVAAVGGNGAGGRGEYHGVSLFLSKMGKALGCWNPALGIISLFAI